MKDELRQYLSSLIFHLCLLHSLPPLNFSAADEGTVESATAFFVGSDDFGPNGCSRPPYVFVRVAKPFLIAASCSFLFMIESPESRRRNAACRPSTDAAPGDARSRVA